MKLDFLEIGTCDFDTISGSSNNQTGMVIEIIQEYIDKIPDRDGLIKICAAIMPQHTTEESVDVYYIEEQDINKHNLPMWIKRCNSVRKPHDLHVEYMRDIHLWHKHKALGITCPNTRNLVTEGIVKNKKVPCIRFKDIIEKYNITHIEKIKTDINYQRRSHIGLIILDIMEYYRNDISKLPNHLEFELGPHVPKIEQYLALEAIEPYYHYVYVLDQNDNISGVCAYRNTIDPSV